MSSQFKAISLTRWPHLKYCKPWLLPGQSVIWGNWCERVHKSAAYIIWSFISQSVMIKHTRSFLILILSCFRRRVFDRASRHALSVAKCNRQHWRAAAPFTRCQYQKRFKLISISLAKCRAWLSMLAAISITTLMAFLLKWINTRSILKLSLSPLSWSSGNWYCERLIHSHILMQTASPSDQYGSALYTPFDVFHQKYNYR